MMKGHLGRGRLFENPLVFSPPRFLSFLFYPHDRVSVLAGLTGIVVFESSWLPVRDARTGGHYVGGTHCVEGYLVRCCQWWLS